MIGCRRSCKSYEKDCWFCLSATHNYMQYIHLLLFPVRLERLNWGREERSCIIWSERGDERTTYQTGSKTPPRSGTNGLHECNLSSHILSFGMTSWIDEKTHDCLKRMEIILEWDLGESGFLSSSRCAQAAHLFDNQRMHDEEKREVIFSWRFWGGWVWLGPDPMSLICIRCHLCLRKRMPDTYVPRAGK